MGYSHNFKVSTPLNTLNSERSKTTFERGSLVNTPFFKILAVFFPHELLANEVRTLQLKSLFHLFYSIPVFKYGNECLFKMRLFV